MVLFTGKKRKKKGKKEKKKKKKRLPGNKGMFHMGNTLSAEQDRHLQPLRAWEGACPFCALDASLRGLKTTLIQRCHWVMAHFKGFGIQCALVFRRTEGRNLGQCPCAGLSSLPVFSKGHTCLLGSTPRIIPLVLYFPTFLCPRKLSLDL